ncbi:hypothetical protein Q7A53_05280 [Halobacillus rhizosphaerae]|uniref:hypothetical protein n=1 Tax=Halobacillus rhizosphaerae TaxID=3064889 RepID=UPI00398B2026
MIKRIENSEPPKGHVRAYRLLNNDVIQVFNLLLEFENNIFYEVIEEQACFDKFGSLSIYKRTGRKFTPEQLNEMVK